MQLKVTPFRLGMDNKFFIALFNQYDLVRYHWLSIYPKLENWTNKKSKHKIYIGSSMDFALHQIF